MTFSKMRFATPKYTLLFFHKLIAGVCLALSIGFLFHPEAYQKEFSETETINFYFLQKGDYQITFSLIKEPSSNSQLRITSEKTVTSDNCEGIILAEKTLAPDDITGSLALHLEQDTYDIQVEIENDAEEILPFSSFRIQSVQLLCTDHYLLSLLCFLAAAGVILLGLYVSPQKYRWPLLAVFFGLAASFPLANDFLLGADNTDISFHLARLESVYRGLLAGEIPVRIGSVQMNGYGSLSAMMYPQLFLYPAAFLRIFRVSLLLCYKLLIAGLNIGCALITYYALKNICRSEKIGILTSFFYTFSIYRMVNIYQRGALGESLAMVFFPLVIWGIYEILWNRYEKWPVLVFGVTGILQSHVLSLEICVIFLTGAVIWRLLQKDRAGIGRRLLAGVKAAVATILLNCSFLIPFLYFSREDLQCFHMPNELPSSLLYFNQMFFSFPHADGFNVKLGSLAEEMPLTVGGVLLLGMILFAIMASTAPKDDPDKKIGVYCLVWGMIALFITSWVFPWNILSKIPFVYALSCSLQFAWRFLGAASIFLCIVAAIGLKLFEEKPYGGKWIYMGAFLLVFLSTAFFFEASSRELSQSNDKMRINAFLTTDSMYMYYDGISYKPHHLDYKYSVPCMSSASRQASFTDFYRKGSGLQADVTPGSAANDTLIFPIYYYPGYKVLVNGSRVEGFCYDTLLACPMPAGPSHVEVRYTGPAAFRAGDIITLCTLFAGVLFFFNSHRKNRKSH